MIENLATSLEEFEGRKYRGEQGGDFSKRISLGRERKRREKAEELALQRGRVYE